MQEKPMTGYPSIDKPWLKYYSREAIDAQTPKCSIYQNIYESNVGHLSDVALLYYGKKISYKQLFENIEKAAKALIALGVNKGDNVAICMPAIPETIYLVLALNRVGANANLLNPTFTEEQLRDRINETNAKLFFVVNELYDRVKNILSQTKIQTIISCAAVNSLGVIVKTIKKAKPIANTIAWNDFLKRGKGMKFTDPEYEPNYPAIMVYSSGTTGASKGIQLTNDSINASILQYRVAGFKMARQDRYFAQVPIWFSTGISITMIVPLCLGITVILEPLYDFDIFYDHIKKYKPHYIITATALVDFLISKNEKHAAFKSFRYLSIGGEYVAPKTERHINEWLKENGATEMLYKGYGMCECGGTVTFSTQECNTVGSSGIPMPQVIVSAFDKNTNKELKYGERGEIRVISPCKMLGYYNNPDATAKYFHTDEKGNVWACTGDMGYVTEDGNVYVSGRFSDSYENGEGDTIYLFDIERTILDVESVRQCKGVVSDLNGEKYHVMHIALAPSSDIKSTLKQISTLCRQRLPENYFPKYIKIYGAALPVAPSGKLDTAKMKESTNDLIELREKEAEERIG